MRWNHVDYHKLHGRQQEIYNFQKSAALLADYGFNCIKLADDWRGADFLADHKDGETLRVQLKSRLTIDKKYCGLGLWINFPVSGNWYLIEHDELLRIVGESTTYLTTATWVNKGHYHSDGPKQALLDRLRDYLVGAQR